MPRPGRRRQVERNRWRQFRTVGESFAQAAEMATEFQYWNVAGVLLVHAAIALTDALTVPEPIPCLDRSPPDWVIWPRYESGSRSSHEKERGEGLAESH